MSFANSVGRGTEKTVETIVDVAKGGGLHSNKAINPLANFTGVVEAAGRLIKGEKFPQALRKTFGKYSEDGKTLLEGDKAGWDVGKIAGSYIGAAAAGRVISGGGVYKDGKGNTNLVGIPFV